MKILKIILPILMLVVGAVENSFALRAFFETGNYDGIVALIKDRRNKDARENLINHIDAHFNQTECRGNVEAIEKFRLRRGDKHTVVRGRYKGRNVLANMLTLIGKASKTKGKFPLVPDVNLSFDPERMTLTLACKVRNVILDADEAYEWIRGKLNKKIVKGRRKDINTILNSDIKCFLHFENDAGTLVPGEDGNGQTGSLWVELK